MTRQRLSATRRLDTRKETQLREFIVANYGEKIQPGQTIKIPKTGSQKWDVLTAETLEGELQFADIIIGI